MERAAVQGSRSRETRCSRRYMVYTLIKTIDADNHTLSHGLGKYRYTPWNYYPNAP